MSEEKTTRHILGLSGGKDSTALALFMRDKVPDMEYVFCDTGCELEETYTYLDRVEAYLGKKVHRLNSRATFTHWLEIFDGCLPSPKMRWCTKLLKLRPFEEFIGEGDVVSYVGIRADEDRIGYISTKDNIRAVFPFKDYGIDLKGVMKILDESGLGLPPYLSWGRLHSGCYFCFFQRTIEWVRLYETHNDQFEKALALEKFNPERPEKTYTWIQGLPLSELRKPEVREGIKQRDRESQDQYKKNRANKTLGEVLGYWDDDEYAEKACLICQL
jgi:3'-phosphoadenosine 5'-phosphosulfate sulfotransferase (PAPS reductase)/FAD synthetase